MFVVFEQNPQLYNAADCFRLFEDLTMALGHAHMRGFDPPIPPTNRQRYLTADDVKAEMQRSGLKVVSGVTGPGATVYIVDTEVIKSAKPQPLPPELQLQVDTLHSISAVLVTAARKDEPLTDTAARLVQDSKDLIDAKLALLSAIQKAGSGQGGGTNKTE